ncbi:MAG: glycosyltransferase [Ignavibacteriales bacterium]|jgi:glycosyltransferase involved in cell wall biosynthesis|nr:glycosyltransferase [Ignavibacteriales bacterium]
MSRKLSVAVIAGSEEEHIAACLESARFADEVVVIVDAKSRDRTEELARGIADKVIVEEWRGFAGQKALSIAECSHEWALSLDADERVTPELRDEILALLAGEPACDGYKIPRRAYYGEKWIKRCGWYPGYQLRLFRREKTTVSERLVHEGFEVKGRVCKLRNDLLHYTHRTVADTVAKINKYSSLDAEQKWERKRVSAFAVAAHPPFAFLKKYVLKGGFLDGAAGLMVSLLHMLTNLLTYMKLYERRRGELTLFAKFDRRDRRR